MDLVEIERSVESTNVGAILVPARILRRVIKRHRKLPGVGLEVPHGTSYVLSREALLSIATEEEIGCTVDRLAESVILLPRPDPGGDPTDQIIALWRGAFHAAVHREIERRIAAGELPHAAVRARIHRIGQTEFDEIRFVLKQDDLLLPPHDDAGTYGEFVATYLELRTFAPDALSRTFPSLGDLSTIDQAIAADVDVRSVLDQCRPSCAPPLDEVIARSRPPRESEPPPPPPPPSREPVVDPGADAARAKGNAVRSILLRARAAGTEHAVREEVRALMERVAAAASWKDAPVDDWAGRVVPVVVVAPSVSALPWNPEARFLYDLQKACIDNEREVFTIGVVEWALSFGRRPVRRALPAQREVRIVKHLRAAQEKLGRLRIVEANRAPLTELLHAWIRRAEHNLRTALRPRFEAALHAVGLVPKNAPERVAEDKLVAELTDHVTEHGFVSLSQLRDAIARNNLKMENLRLRELWEGDALLKADKILSLSLDGVYRRGEFYLRFLQKLSSITFGTPVGRVLTLYLILPVLCAYVAIEGVHHMLGPLLEKVFGVDEHAIHWLNPISLGGLSVFVFALIHSQLARRATMWVLRLVGAALRMVFFRAPAFVLSLPPVKRALKSRPVVIFARYVLKPAAFTAVGWVVVPLLDVDRKVTLIALGVVFIVWNVLLNSKTGILVEEAVVDGLVRSWRQIHKRVLPGILALIVAVFRRFLEAIDRMIYSVDELLRFRAGEGSTSLVVKGSLGVVWFFITYLIRIYINLLVEPEVNPIKHFPVVTVAAKIMLPVNVPIHNAMHDVLAPVVTAFVAEPFIFFTIFVLPGFFGFLVWELKENWRLYRMNRSENLAPVLVGHHGETMVAFMKPGFHSGTVPKAYARLRRAAWRGERTVHKHKEALHHVEEAVRRFTERELFMVLEHGGRWTGGPLEVVDMEIASNRMRIAIRCVALGEGTARIAFEEQSGWLVGSMPSAGFVDALVGDQRVVFENALAGFYKMAGVEIVREQIATRLGAGVPYDVDGDNLVVWPDGSYKNEVVFDLRKAKLFRDEPIAWSAWVESWGGATRGRLLGGPEILPLPGKVGDG